MKNFFLILISHLKTPQYLLKNISWRFPKTVSQEEVIFVMGTPRSGTTLLQKIIEEHSKLFSIDQETAMFSFQNFWEPTRMHFNLKENEKNILLKTSKDNVDFFQNCIKHLAVINPGKRFVEKTPQHIKHLKFLLKFFPNAKFIHIVRDGRDCYCSARKHPFIPQSSSIKKFSKYYNFCLSQGINAIDNDRVFTLKYEDLVSTPEIYLRKVMRFVGLEVEEHQFSKASRSTDKRAQLKQFQKLNDPINNSSVERWRNELSIEEVGEFNKYSHDSLKFFGYPTN